jgi:O-antigen ligase
VFYNTNLDLRGDHVHNVYLSIQAELGIVGAILFALLLILGVEIAIQPYSEEANSVYRYVLLSSAVAFAIIGVVDHYVWTMIHFQTLWLSLFVLSGRTSSHAL